MADDPKPQSWWQTLPGILTSLTGMITAIVGLLAYLNQAGLLPGVKSASSMPMTTPVAVESVAVLPPTTHGPGTAGGSELPSESEVSDGLPRSNDPDGKVRNFVKKFLSVQDTGDVPALLELYGSQVDYYGHPGVSRDFILKDKENYYRQWRVEENALVGKIAIAEGPTGGEKIATFTVHYRAVSDRLAKSSEGTATNVLTIRNKDGELRIVGEIQTFYRRGTS